MATIVLHPKYDRVLRPRIVLLLDVHHKYLSYVVVSADLWRWFCCISNNA